MVKSSETQYQKLVTMLAANIGVIVSIFITDDFKTSFAIIIGMWVVYLMDKFIWTK